MAKIELVDKGELRNQITWQKINPIGINHARVFGAEIDARDRDIANSKPTIFTTNF